MKKYYRICLLTICFLGGQAVFAQSTEGVMCPYGKTLSNEKLGLESVVEITCGNGKRTIGGNGIPWFEPGDFPNRNNPNRISKQKLRYSVPLNPVLMEKPTEVRIPGITLEGVKMEPGTAETYRNQGKWRYEAIQNTLDLGLDDHNAHVQPTGEYHYHGLPKRMAESLGQPAMIGWAGDGFPIYGNLGHRIASDPSSGLVPVKSSYRLKTIPDNGRPESVEMGTFTQDYEYAEGLGDLDECNGRFGPTPEFPEGIYHYYITDDFPYISRCLKGKIIDKQFIGFGGGRPPKMGNKKQSGKGPRGAKPFPPTGKKKHPPPPPRK